MYCSILLQNIVFYDKCNILPHSVVFPTNYCCVPIFNAYSLHINSLFSLYTPSHNYITQTYTTTHTHAYGSIYFDNMLIYF